MRPAFHIPPVPVLHPIGPPDSRRPLPASNAQGFLHCSKLHLLRTKYIPYALAQRPSSAVPIRTLRLRCISSSPPGPGRPGVPSFSCHLTNDVLPDRHSPPCNPRSIPVSRISRPLPRRFRSCSAPPSFPCRSRSHRETRLRFNWTLLA